MKRRHFLHSLALAPLFASGFGRAMAGVAEAGRLVSVFGSLPAASEIARVYATGAPAGVLVYALAPEKLLGWPARVSDEARALLPRVRADLPHLGRLSGRGSTVSTEGLLALQPDVLLDAGSVTAAHRSNAERVWQQTRMPYVLMDGRLADHPAQLRHVGRLLGMAERGEALAAQAQAVLDLAAEVLAKVPEPRRPRVYFGRGPDGLETGLADAINMETLAVCGARNVAAAAGRGGMTQVSPEQLLAWNPDVVVTQEPRFQQQLLHDALWRSLDAVRTRRVYLAPQLPFGWLDGPPGINRLLGVPWLLARLYPGLHPGLAPEKLDAFLATLHTSFYGSAMPGAS